MYHTIVSYCYAYHVMLNSMPFAKKEMAVASSEPRTSFDSTHVSYSWNVNETRPTGDVLTKHTKTVNARRRGRQCMLGLAPLCLVMPNRQRDARKEGKLNKNGHRVVGLLVPTVPWCTDESRISRLAFHRAASCVSFGVHPLSKTTSDPPLPRVCRPTIYFVGREHELT